MSQYVLKNSLLLTIREAQPDDAANMLEYAENITLESENIARAPGELGFSLEQERELLQDMLQSPASIFLVAEIAGEIIGDLNFRAMGRARLKHRGEMGISVRQRYWGLGIGSHLLTELITWAQAGGLIRKIDLQVRVDNLSAIHLYEKHGFVHEGRITRGLYIRGEFVDLFCMGRLIDPL